MRINCEVEVSYSLSHGGYTGKSTRCKAAICLGRKEASKSKLVCQDKKDQIFLLLITAKNSTGTKYFVEGNIEKIYCKFVKDGKATIKFKEPAHLLSISKADPKQLHNLVQLLQSSPRKQREEKLVPMLPSKANTIESVPTKLVVTVQRNYPVNGFPATLQRFEAVGISLNRIDKRLAGLQNLVCLDLSNNRISVIPESLQGSSLVELKLAGNKIEEYPLALCLGNISTSLQSLDLSRNLLTNLPTNFVQLQKLVQLKLDCNQLTTLPKSFGKLANLKYFSASSNQITILPHTFRRLQLESIDMFGNPFSGPGLLRRCDSLSLPCLQELAARVIRRDRLRYSPKYFRLEYAITWTQPSSVCVCALVSCSFVLNKAHQQVDKLDTAPTTTFQGSWVEVFHNVLSALQGHWLGNFCLNLLGYGLIIVPAALLIRRLRKNPLVERGQGPLYSFLRLCVHGSPKDELPVKASDVETVTASPTKSAEPSSLDYYVKLIFCILGLQISYITWGVLQERIMTQSYDGEQFTNSQFLVFVNRILAWCVAGIYIFSTRQPRHVGPFYEYSYASISNTLSSWCQYEALKFVSFPTQVLAKSFKVVPVMLMGKVVSNRTYPPHEYFTAIMLSVGVSLFLLSKDDSSHPSTATTFAGIIILGGYMMFDSFTSNWQSELFKKYKMSPIQMMLGVNTFSCIFTVGSLLFRGEFLPNIGFILKHFEFAIHAVILSVCSAVGQLFIFYTIATFGPLVFTLIMTTRQAISIITSCLIYGHILSIQALIGVGIVFLSLFLRAYFKTLEKKSGPK